MLHYFTYLHSGIASFCLESRLAFSLQYPCHRTSHRPCRPSVESTEAFAVTTDGEPGVVSNGVPDWVYEGKFQCGEFI